MKRGWLTGIILLLVGLPFTVALAQVDVSVDMMRYINEERALQGLPMLTVNSQLIVAAGRHSVDMAQADVLTHTGTDGSEFWDRIVTAAYPMDSGAENVLYRWDTSVQGAFQQWMNSPPHRANMLNGVYQEMGVAYAVSASGRVYFTLVLASRVNYSAPISTLTIPPTNTAAPTQAPPSPVAVITRGVMTFTPQPTGTPAPPSLTPIVFAPGQGGSNAPSVPQATLIPTWTLLPPKPDEIRLIYDVNTFILQNISNQAINLYGLSFINGTRTFESIRWDSEFTTARLGAFPADDCLQIWSVYLEDDLPKSSICDSRHGWVTTNPVNFFWTDGETFEVFLDEERVTTCEIDAGECAFRLDERLPLPNASATPIRSGNGSADNGSASTGQSVSSGRPTPYTTANAITLLYAPEGFTLINSSGGVLDIRGLNFSSANGQISSNEWDNGYLSRPLGAFTPGTCLQVWSIYQDFDPAIPSTCESRAAYLRVGDYRQFWRDADVFTVSQSGLVLATCTISAGQCTFDLP